MRIKLQPNSTASTYATALRQGILGTHRYALHSICLPCSCSVTFSCSHAVHKHTKCQVMAGEAVETSVELFTCQRAVQRDDEESE